jgi:hypothetical protein
MNSEIKLVKGLFGMVDPRYIGEPFRDVEKWAQEMHLAVSEHQKKICQATGIPTRYFKEKIK